MRTTPLLMAFMTIAFLTGCKPATQPEAKPTSSTLNTFIEGATGKTALDAGKRAEETIRRVSAQHETELNEALGE